MSLYMQRAPWIHTSIVIPSSPPPYFVFLYVIDVRYVINVRYVVQVHSVGRIMVRGRVGM